MELLVAISTVVDGSMYNRNDENDTTVIANRQDYLQTLGISLDQTSRVRVGYNRTNFCKYISVKETDKGKGMRGDDIEIADALITTDKNHALFLPVADCVGATIYDPVHQVIALAHLGRHSLEQDGAHSIITYLQKHFQSTPEDIKIWLTPAPSKASYPIWKIDNKGMKEATFEQLRAAGIVDNNIIDNPAETDKDQNYFSYSEYLKGHRESDGDHAMVAMMRD